MRQIGALWLSDLFGGVSSELDGGIDREIPLRRRVPRNDEASPPFIVDTTPLYKSESHKTDVIARHRVT